MKQSRIKIFSFILSAALTAPFAIQAQDEKDIKEEKKEKKDVQQIIITRKGEKDEKVVVEINGDKVTINGKPVDDFKNGDVTVRLNKLKDMEFLTRIPNVSGSWNFNSGDQMNLFRDDANRAMLGVTTEKTDEGAEINNVTKESAAEKMGLKEGDIITKVGDKKIETPDDLSAAIKAHKPGSKVNITYLRDKKEQKGTAELTAWKAQGFNLNMGDMNWEKIIPNVPVVPRVTVPGQHFRAFGNTPKLGLSVQDTDEGNGVKVLEVDDESNAAKAGIKENDIITEVDGKPVNSTDEIVKIFKESKDKVSVMFKLKREGKTQNVEVKMPRKLKTTDL